MLRCRRVLQLELMAATRSNEGPSYSVQPSFSSLRKRQVVVERQGDLVRVMVVPPGAPAAVPDPEASPCQK
jgi:hypothetical protein